MTWQSAIVTTNVSCIQPKSNLRGHQNAGMICQVYSDSDVARDQPDKILGALYISRSVWTHSLLAKGLGFLLLEVSRRARSLLDVGLLRERFHSGHKFTDRTSQACNSLSTDRERTRSRYGKASAGYWHRPWNNGRSLCSFPFACLVLICLYALSSVLS